MSEMLFVREEEKILSEVELLVVEHAITVEGLLLWCRLGAKMADRGVSSVVAKLVLESKYCE